MVAGHEDDFGDASAECAEHRLGRRERTLGAGLGELEDVAQQHQAIDPVDRAEEQFERRALAQHVAPQARAEVQVGDDERPHRRSTMPQSARGALCRGRAHDRVCP